MMNPLSISIGFNARLFPGNWRPARDEFAFAGAYGFQALQIRRDDAAITEQQLGDSFSTIAEQVRATPLGITLELVMHVNAHGQTPSGQTPLDILAANLPAIQALNSRFVHWHLVPTVDLIAADRPALEDALTPVFAAAVDLAHAHRFELGFEHNEPDVQLFSSPASCQRLLQRVPGLKFVWDFNHTSLQDLPDFLRLIPHMRALHVSDTPLPDLNHHLPLGKGTVDLAAYLRAVMLGDFHGPAILEIGGLPKSGGMGRDTNAALVDSAQRLRHAIDMVAAH